MTTKSSNSNSSTKLISQILFFVLVVALSTVSIFVTFRGLSTAHGMEQAETGREIAAGNGYTTKVIRPAAIEQIKKATKETPSLKNFPDTYHAPLNPCINAIVLKAVDANNTKLWKMPKDSNIYELDRILAGVSVLFFLVSIGVNYLLISKIFDVKIATATAFLMLFSNLMWEFTQSGLPQMLMLMLFSFGILFLWEAVEKKERNQSPLRFILFSGIFMSLMVISHWITLWMYIGFVIFSVVYFKPKGIIAVSLIAILALFVVPTVYFIYVVPTGSPFGTAYYAIHNGLGNSEDLIMRNFSPDTEALALQGLLLNILRASLLQISDLFKNLGAILVAPLFFLALLHPFKRPSIGAFRWFILLMWVFASVGMSIYGLKKGAMDPNQIHILFSPLMTAYGLAIVSVLWARLGIAKTHDFLRNAHLILIIAISAGPMLINFPKEIKDGLRASTLGGFPNYPPYFPKAFNLTLADNTTESDVIISDTPWAVAWYANRISVWLPKNLEQIASVEKIAIDHQTPVQGVVISPYSFNDGPVLSTGSPGKAYGELFPLVYNSFARMGNYKNINFIDINPQFQAFSQRYAYKYPLFSYGYIMYYSNREITTKSQ